MSWLHRCTRCLHFGLEFGGGTEVGAPVAWNDGGFRGIGKPASMAAGALYRKGAKTAQHHRVTGGEMMTDPFQMGVQ
ncbi:MAG: hypothetical protein Kow006_12660 [Gammaproteobacteria bacterium]